ncbi:WW domain-containing transcription regulator protein 1 [Anopheles sinensis]|uniref:WW domain-containing transcription regulator protein 1 n=1 Tax=Anopheles sinensis TaxID=74873 RepID=A0A084VJR7_ANOSI|nr:WW domain-containing transcription regulator protein 1 [Anopheles sinensis]
MFKVYIVTYDLIMFQRSHNTISEVLSKCRVAGSICEGFKQVRKTSRQHREDDNEENGGTLLLASGDA